MKHPIQRLATDEHGIMRFVENPLVRALLDHGQATGLGLNELTEKFCGAEYREDWEQLAQLIGYSLAGFGTLSYASEYVCATAENMQQDTALCELAARVKYLEGELNYFRELLHPSDLTDE